MMRIGFDVSYIQKRCAGLGRYSAELLRALLAADKENEYILHGWSWSLDKDMLGLFAQPNVRMKWDRVPGPVKRFYWNVTRVPDIRVFTGAIDIFQSMDPFLPPSGKNRTVATVHDLAQLKFPDLFGRSVHRWGRFLGASLGRADAILVPSESTARDVAGMLRIPGERIHIVRPPVSPVFRAEASPDADRAVLSRWAVTQPYALFVGTLEPRKNVPALIAAFERHHARCRSDLHLVIIGRKGWLHGDTMTSILTSRLKTRIRHLDFVPDIDLAALYRQARCFVYPSLYEGHGSPVAEAMASETPVITSANSSLKEIGEGVARLVDPGNVDEIADAITDLRNDDAQCRSRALAGRERVKRFDHRTCADTLLGLYHSVVPS